MGIVITALLWIIGIILVMGLILLLMFAGFVMGKRAPVEAREGNVSLSSEINEEVYKALLEKGGYSTEQQLLNDALTILNWGLDVAVGGRHTASCNYDGTQLMEFNIDAFSALRAKNHPITYLERCLWLDMPESGEGENNNDSH